MKMWLMGPVLLILCSQCIDVTTGIACNAITDCYECVKNDNCRYCATDGCRRSGTFCSSKYITNNFNCPLEPEIDYNDEFTRYRIYPLIGATKAHALKDIMKCAQKADPDIVLLKRINVTCTPGADVYCTTDVYVHPKLKRISIVSHGAETPELRNLVAFHIFLVPSMKEMKGIKGKVMSFYADTFSHMWKNGVEASISRAVKENPKFEIHVVGFSLGAAISALIAPRLVLDDYATSESLTVYSFAEPRVGNVQFAEFYETLVPKYWRLTNKNDPFINVPHSFSNRDSNLNVYQHRRHQVYYPDGQQLGAKYIICDMPEDPKCLSHKPGGDLYEHRTTFNVFVLDWWKSGCSYNPDIYQSPNLMSRDLEYMKLYKDKYEVFL